MAQKLCDAIKRNGQPCQSWACSGSDFCFAHDPAQAKERQAARRKGGLARHKHVVVANESEPIRLQTIADVLAFLEKLAGDLMLLNNTPQKIRAGTALANAARAAIQDGELEVRVNEVLAILKRRE